MRYIDDNTLCLQYSDLVPLILTKDAYDKAKSRGTIVPVGRGGNGREVLIPYTSLPAMYQQKVRKCYGNPYEFTARNVLVEKFHEIHADNARAREYFQGLVSRRDMKFKPEHVAPYVKAASMLDLLTAVILTDEKWIKKHLNITLNAFWRLFYTEYSWKQLPDGSRIKEGRKGLGLIDQLIVDLPASAKLKRKWKAYCNEGYSALLNGRFNNSNSRKVDKSLEKLIISLYAQANPKPTMREVCEQLQAFFRGEISIIDQETGEIFENSDYGFSEGFTLSEKTVRSYLNIPINRALVDVVRTGSLEFNSKHRPHVIRKAPKFSLSKISMDDIAIPFKMPDGSRVWSYQIFDVASGAVIGVSFGREKSQQLIRDAVLNMFQLIAKNGWGIPAEIEVEQHLNSGMKGSVSHDGTFSVDILTEGAIFPFVRFCRGGNPQEKRAEGFIRAKKYQIQAKRPGFQYRPFARSEAKRLNKDIAIIHFTYDEVVANELEDIAAYNAALHPKQNEHPGRSRWQVLEDSMNGDLLQPNFPAIMPYIGEKTETSVIRNQYVMVRYHKYLLPSLSVIEKLQTVTVDAYFMPTAGGVPDSVFLYQNGVFLCQCTKVEPYQEAQQEMKPADTAAMEKQLGYISEFDGKIRRRRAATPKLKFTEVKPSYTDGSEILASSEVLPSTLPDVQNDEWWTNEEAIVRKATNDFFSFKR